MSQKTPIPPKWPDRFLSWYCNDRVREQVQGDAHELFYWRLEDKGISRARRAFMWDVVRLFKWSNIKRTNRQKQQLNNIAMFKNYFKIGLRNLWKQKVPSTINCIGLALAIACCLVAYKFAERDFFIDTFHEKKDQIYLVTPVKMRNNTPRTSSVTDSRISDLIVTDVPGLEAVTRYQSTVLNITSDDREFRSYVGFVDRNFFSQFSFEIIHGEPDPLNAPDKIVVDEKVAEKHFGDQHAIGKTIRLKLQGREKEFVVSAVIREVGDFSSFQTGYLIPFENYKNGLPDGFGTIYTFLTVNEQVQINQLQDNITQLLDFLPDEEKGQYREVRLTPFTKLMSLFGELDEPFAFGINYTGIAVVGGIASFMLLLAIFNYINIATVMAMRRVKEIGIRKVIGGKRRQLVLQFLTENFILCCFTMVMGALLARVFLPWFNLVADENYFFDLANNYRVWTFMIALLLLITLASGMYPALVVSRQRPITILKKLSGKREKNRLIRVLLTIQLILALITLVNAVMFIQIEWHNKTKDWGFDRKSYVSVTGIPANEFETFRNKVEGLAAVRHISTSQTSTSNFGYFKQIKSGEKKFAAMILQGDVEYPKAIGLRLLKGRYLLPDSRPDQETSIVVNELFMRRAGLDSLNAQVKLDSITYRVVGIVQDNYNWNLPLNLAATIVKWSPDDDANQLIANTTPESLEDVKASLVNLADPFIHKLGVSVQASPDIYEGYFKVAARTRNLMLFSASLVILLAGMGIFGVVSLGINNRIKFFGIKKVLGASRRHLYKDVYKPFLIVVIIALVIGAATSVIIVNPVLELAFTDPQSVSALAVLLAAGLLMVVGVLTINTQVRRLVRLNPVETLRDE
ncbi:MAG: FtsX-like permease family protein [Roseivirga sp.]|nr:FtsX-like permease family protein [Roseivirga sp.]